MPVLRQWTMRKTRQLTELTVSNLLAEAYSEEKA
jgi:hypothetical protein